VAAGPERVERRPVPALPGRRLRSVPGPAGGHAAGAGPGDARLQPDATP